MKKRRGLFPIGSAERIRRETADERGITPPGRGSPRAADPDSPGRSVPKPILSRPLPPEPAA